MTCIATHGIDDPCATCDAQGLRCDRCAHAGNGDRCEWAPTAAEYERVVGDLVVLATRESVARDDCETCRAILVHAREILRAPKGEGLVPACERLVARLDALQVAIARLERQVEEDA